MQQTVAGCCYIARSFPVGTGSVKKLQFLVARNVRNEENSQLSEAAQNDLSFG